MKITVRPYKKEDTVRLLELYRKTEKVADPEAWARTFLGKRAFVAEIEGELAGFGEIDIDISCTACSTGEISRLYVAPEYRGMGVGRALLIAIEDCAQKNIVGVVGVWSIPKAIPFFESMGYGAIREADGLCFMRKRI